MTTNRFRRLNAAVLVLIALAAVISGCGSSTTTTTATSTITTSSASTKPPYCAALTKLEESVKNLSKVNVAQTGLNGVKSAVTQVVNDANMLVNEAKTAFSADAEAIKASASKLQSTLKEAAASPSASTLGQLPAQVAEMGTSVSGFAGDASAKCG